MCISSMCNIPGFLLTDFRSMFATDGLINSILIKLGILSTGYNFLGNSTSAKIVIIIALIWRWTGYNMVFYLAGLQNIEYSVYEAAKIDGANGWKTFWKITVPLLKPTTIYVITISVYAGLSMFLESFMLWNGNSSPKNIGLTIVGYLYKRGIEKNDMGYACAVGMVLLVIALAINVVQLVATGTFKKEER